MATALSLGGACTSAAAPEPPAVATVTCAATNRPAGVRLGANVNVLFWEAHYDDAALIAAVRDLGSPVLRVPGGTESDYFDWAQGRPVDSCRYAGCRTWDSVALVPPALYQRFGSFERGTPDAFASLATRTSGTALLVANTVTASIEESVEWMATAAGAAVTPPLIELANEPYFGQVEGTDNTRRLFPTAESHVAYTRGLIAAVRSRLPSARLAYPAFVPRVDAATGAATPGHDARMLTWNTEVLTAGIAAEVDAFALHFYPRLPARAGADDAAYLRTLAGFAAAYWSGTIAQPQWTQLPADRRLWITELNASFTDAPELVGTWIHGLIQAQLMLLMLQDARVEIVLQHMLTGNAQWQAVVHPGRADDVVPAPGFTAYARTASGEGLAALSAALSGAGCIRALPATATGVVGVLATTGDAQRVVLVNASSMAATFDAETVGWRSAAAVERQAPPFARIGAGSSLAFATLSPDGTGRRFRIAPHAIVTITGTP